METLMQDLRYSLRLLAKSPSFTALTIVTMALGIAANAVIFTLVDAALLRPLPYAEPNRLMAIFDSRQQDVGSRFESSYPDFLDWQKQATAFSSVAGYSQNDVVLHTGKGPDLVAAGRVSANFFSALGVQPALGRDFHADEEPASAARVVILSDMAFHKRFGGRHEVVGSTVMINEEPATVVGVLPRGFSFAPIGSAEMWFPLRPRPQAASRRNLHWLNVVARLKPDASLKSASADMDVVTRRLEQAYPDSNGKLRALVIPLTEVVVGDVRPILSILFAAVELLLLIACANVANLLLSRSMTRRREMAVRTALGAARMRLVRQMLTEGLVLAAVAALIGTGLAWGALRVLPSLINEDMLSRVPFFANAGLNLHVALFVIASSLLAGILFSVAPAMQTSQKDVQQTLRQGTGLTVGRGWRRFASSFVISEIAMAMVLLVGAALLVKTLHRLLNVELGFNPDRIVTLEVSLPRRYDNNEKVLTFYRSLREKLRALPGVESVGTSDILPLNGGNTINSRLLTEDTNTHHEANIRSITPDYFPTIQARMVRGRMFDEHDDATAPQRVIVNQRYVDLFLGGRDPLTTPILFTFSPTQKPREIVGVVGNVREGPLDADPKPAVYTPWLAGPDSDFPIAIRTSGRPDAIVSEAQKLVHEMEGDSLVYQVRTMQEIIDDSPAATLHRYAAWLVAAFALAALALGVIGLYSVITHSVTQRTQEIGVRMALGAQRSNVLRLVLGDGLRMLVIGGAIGVAASLFATRLMRGFLFSVRAWDPLAFFVSLLLLGAVAVLASCIPAMRAAKVNPIQALRYE